MNARISLLLLVLLLLLGAVVSVTAARIEWLNWEAGSYLPRKDKLPDGSFADGAWRVSRTSEPRDELRGLILSAGLRQYALAPLLAVGSLGFFFLSRRRIERVMTSLCFSAGVLATGLMFYREYWSSLGS